MGVDASQLFQLLSQYVDQKLSRVSAEEHGWLEAAVQDFSLDGPILKIWSGVIVDLRDVESIRTHLSFEETIEFRDRSNWQKWRSIEPTLIADLERCEEISREVGERFGVEVSVDISEPRVYFVSEVVDGDMDSLLAKGYMVIDALFEAWRSFGEWLRGPERLRVVRKSGKHKNFLDRL